MSDTAPFDTPLLRQWRKETLSEHFTHALNTIAKFGFQIMLVKADAASPSFGYTTGIFDTCGGPELITVGLPLETAHAALNHAGDLIRQGVDLTQGRFREIIGNVEVKFREVDPKWLPHVMLRANWYYRGQPVPVLQLIYPDLRNRFEGEEGFDSRFIQPVLSSDDLKDHATDTFWAAHDPASALGKWKFEDSPHTGAYLSETVFNKEESITYVSHDPDGDWQFLGDKMDAGGGPVLVCLHHPIEEDRSLEELADLPVSWYAIRDTPGEPWRRFEHGPENIEDGHDTKPSTTPAAN